MNFLENRQIFYVTLVSCANQLRKELNGGNEQRELTEEMNGGDEWRKQIKEINGGDE